MYNALNYIPEQSENKPLIFCVPSTSRMLPESIATPNPFVVNVVLIAASVDPEKVK